MKLSAGIRQRKNSFLVDVTVNGIQRTKTCSSLEQAKLAQAELRAEMLKDTGGVNGDPTWTLRQALDKTIEVAWQDKLDSVNLARNGELIVSILGPATPISKVSVEIIDALVEKMLKQGKANGTINRKLAALSKMLTVAEQRGKLSARPHIARLRESESRIRFLSKSEEVTCLSILDMWGKDEHSEVLCVLIDTGMRPSELWRVTSQDFDEKVINIWKTKNHKARSIPMTGRVGDILLRRAALVGKNAVLFPYNNYWFTHAWDRMKQHMGLQDDEQFIPYALRHTCVSRLVQRGVSLKVVQEWAGHTNIITTMRYAHLCPTNLLDAVKVLEAV